MAILKQTVQVNNGNEGWNSTHVLDALEETFYQMGWNSGTQTNGVVTTCFPPGSNDPWQTNKWSSNWHQAGGGEMASSARVPITTHEYFVTDDSVNETFALRRAWVFSSGQEYSSGNTDDYILINDHGFSDGDEFLYYQGITNKNGNTPNHLFSGATNGQSVFVSVRDDNNLCLHTTNADAVAGTNKINLQALSSGYYLARTTTQATPDPINMEDTIKFTGYGVTLTTDMRFQDQAGAINTQRELNGGNYNNLAYLSFPTHTRMDLVADAQITWHTRGWEQGTYYVTGDAATYSTAITVNPLGGNHYITLGGAKSGQWEATYRPAYWDYTVPQDGTRSALNLRIYREGTGSNGKLDGIEVLDLNSSGWSNGDTFTIPGTAVGGASPENDIVFGVNTPETTTGAGDGICSISVQNFGAGVNSYLKLPNTKTLVVRIENDSAKTYGVTYYSFVLNDNNYQLQVDSYINPDFRNYYPGSSQLTEVGHRGGLRDLDWNANNGVNLNAPQATSEQFTGSSTPTAYPLKIVSYRSQTPQDTNFAVVQFVQTVNGVDTPYFTFTLPKGTLYGQNLWDLDHVWQGGYTKIYGSNQSIFFNTDTGSYTSIESNTTNHIRAREAHYGYTRDVSDAVGGLVTRYATNRYRDNSQDQTDQKETVIYFRDATYDTQRFTETFNGTYLVNINDFDDTRAAVNSSADFDRVIKGVPLQTCVSPSLYTLPEDFVLIDFNYTPGATVFLPGDTITISASEVYEVIMYSYTNSAATYDGIANNSVHGILFCARTT